MAVPGLGVNTWMGLADESTYGTFVTPTKFFEINSETLTKEIRKIRSSSVYQSAMRAGRKVPGAIACSGDVVLDLTWEGWSLFLKHLLGSVATTQPDASAAPTVYDHAFSPTATLPTGMSIEINRDISSFKFQGCKIVGARFSIAVDGVLQLTLSIVAQDVTYGTATTLGTLTESDMIIFTEGVLQWNSVDQDVENAEVEISNNLTVDRRFIGSALIGEPVFDDKRSTVGRFLTDFQSTTLFADFVASTRRLLTLIFTGDTITSPYTQLLTLSMPLAEIDSDNMNVNSPGPIPEEISFEALFNSSNDEITITLRNTETTP